MNLYAIKIGTPEEYELRFFEKKNEAREAAQEIANDTRRTCRVLVIYIAVDRENLVRLANKKNSFYRIIGVVGDMQPKRKIKKKINYPPILAITSVIFSFIILFNSADATTSCTTRKSGSVVITTCTGKNTYTQCRSYRSGSVIKTSCRS